MRRTLDELLALFDQAALNGGLEPADLERGLQLKAKLRGDVERCANAKAHVDEALRVFGVGGDPQVARHSLSRAAWHLSSVFDPAPAQDGLGATTQQPARARSKP